VAFIREQRLIRARQLLQQDVTLSVKEVMVAVGLNDPSHFSHAYQRKFGVSPTADRESKARSVTAAWNCRFRPNDCRSRQI